MTSQAGGKERGEGRWKYKITSDMEIVVAREGNEMGRKNGKN